MLIIFVVIAYFGGVLAVPATGTCMCVHGTGVHVRDAAGLHGHILVSVSTGECYTFNGGVLVKDGYTWYELQNVHGHHKGWVASNYWRASTSSHCSVTSGSTSHGSYATGIVSQACLHCICQHESGCRPLGCHLDVGSDSCGYFQIKQAYWKDCGSPGTSWHECANDLHCASQCVQSYMKRYTSHYGCPLTCESFAREHNGGPRGCTHTSTLGYWHRLQSEPGCHAVH